MPQDKHSTLEKIDSLLRYLSAVAREVGPKPLRDINDAVACIWPDAVPEIPRVKVATKPGDHWLVVAKPPSIPPIGVPKDLQEHVRETEWEDPLRKPTLWREPERVSNEPFYQSGADNEAERIRKERIEAKFANWCTNEWEAWAERYESDAKHRNLYSLLYDLRLEVETNTATHELLWGHLILAAKTSVGEVIAPLVVTPVSISLDTSNGSLVIDPENSTQIDLSSVQGTGLSGLQELVQIQNDFRQHPIDMWDDVPVAQLQKRLAAPLGIDARCPDTVLPSIPNQIPEINRGWALFMRKRPLRQERFYVELATHIEENSVLPEALSSVVMDSEEIERALEIMGQESVEVDSTADRLLLPLPTNAEQESIVRQLARSRGVTVQGPPGTGKSHTIANLVSHLIAQGKRVLVTAEKDQALTVLRDKIPEELQDLSLAVVGSTPAAMAELRDSAQQMVSSISLLDVSREERRIAKLEKRVDKCREKLLRSDAKLVDALQREQREFELPHGFERAGEVAKWITENRKFDLIDDPIPYEPPKSAISEAKFARVKYLVKKNDKSISRKALKILPNEDWIPNYSLIRSQFEREAELNKEMARLEKEGVDFTSLGKMSASQRREFSQKLETASVKLQDVQANPFAKTLIRYLDNGFASEAFFQQHSGISEQVQHVFNYEKELYGHTVSLPDLDPHLQLELLGGWINRVKENRKLPLFGHKNLKEYVSQVKVDGYSASTLEHLQIVDNQLRHTLALEELSVRVGHAYKMLQFDLPTMDANYAYIISELYNTVDQVALFWKNDLADTKNLVTSVLSASKDLLDPEVLKSISAIAKGIVVFDEYHQITTQLAEISQKLSSASQAPKASELWGEYLTAVSKRDAHLWFETSQKVEEYEAMRKVALELKDLRKEFKSFNAQMLFDSFLETQGNFGPLDDYDTFIQAWEIARTKSWLRELHAGVDTDALMRESEKLSAELSSLIVELANRSARVNLKRNLKDSQRRALDTWLTAVKKVGKGTGKNAPRYRAAAREALPGAMGAVPIWIMPIYRVLENFDPTQSELFDVVIVDESSQAGLLSLGVLGLGKKAIVVGDDQQTTPNRVGHSELQINSLQDHYLKGLRPAEAQLLALNESLYSITGRAFSHKIALREHFRCVPDIIRFSNRYYNNSITPLREVTLTEIGDPVRAVKVEGAISKKIGSNRVNRDEAKAIAAQILACVDDPAYDGLTFGVVSMMSGTQSQILQEEIRKAIGESEFAERQLRVGNPPVFQGDERNVMFISTVAHDDSFAATSPMYRQWANVAASRAKDQLWVFYSMDPATLNPEDQRRALIEYATSVSQREDHRGLFDLTESKFEEDILTQLLERGYDVRPQHKVGAYRIDFVVTIGPGERLAVECDGDSFHGPDKYQEDVQRQRVLERIGWNFWRIRASEYYLDPEEAMKPLWRRLNQMRERLQQKERFSRVEENYRALKMKEEQAEGNEGLII